LSGKKGGKSGATFRKEPRTGKTAPARQKRAAQRKPAKLKCSENTDREKESVIREKCGLGERPVVKISEGGHQK